MRIAASSRRSSAQPGFVAAALLALFASLVAAGNGEAASAGSTLITNARLIDGSGTPERRASVRIEGDRIVAVGDLQPLVGEQIVDAAGQVLSPGFIDTHSHHEHGLFEAPDALPVTSQGITTIIVGQDGGSALPLSPLFERMKTRPVAVNIGSYVGHNSIRAAVLGENFRRKATAAEIEQMRARVREGMHAGAIGLSTGLEYDPGIYASRDEVLALAREAADVGGRYISHIRSEDRFIWDALDEIVEVGRATGMPVQVSHMKLAMTGLWGQADRFLSVMNKARAAGVDITGDVYPYEYWQSTLTVMFPDRDFGNRKSAEFALDQIAKPEGLLLSAFSPDPSLVGKTVADVARLRGIDPVDALLQLIAESQVPGATESVIGTSMDRGDIAKLIAWPHSNISSDGELAGRHPRGRGAFPRVLRLYVREQPLLALEQAIHKMSGAPAAHMGIADRGLIRPGMKADLVLLDPDHITDRATSLDPGALSVGILRVWVNGETVLEDGRPTGVRPGQPVLRSRSESWRPAAAGGPKPVG